VELLEAEEERKETEERLKQILFSLGLIREQINQGWRCWI